LRLDADNLRARNLKVMVLRELSQTAEARLVLQDTLRLDRLDWWARHLGGEKIACDLQTQLDLAHDYTRAGYYAEAIELLSAANVQTGEECFSLSPSEGERAGVRGPSNQISRVNHTLPIQNLGVSPLVQYTLGWLEQKRGNHKIASKLFQHAAAQSPDYCFPSRLEEIPILEAAMRANPKDARAPYYLGNLLYDRRRHEEAIRLWERSAKLDPNFSVVWRNLGIGYFNIRAQPAKARAAYDRAFGANPNDARLLFERDQLWKRLGEKPERRLREFTRRLDLVQQRDDLSIELCALYNQTGQHEKSAQLVGSRQFQPWEGGEGGPLGQHVRSQLALGRAALDQQDFTAARSHFESALTSPRNLSEAKHLLANQSDINYWLGCACAGVGDVKSARDCWSAAASFKGDFQEMSVRSFSEMTFYSALSRQKLGQGAKARQLFHDLLAYARNLQKERAKIDYFATSLPTMLLFDDDLQFRQETTALFLQAQAQLGLGQKSKGRTLLQTVLRRDPNHALAADFLREIKP
jgi:tetratricopeptide (TPR) repeat protein